jgi:hypothetical protein
MWLYDDPYEPVVRAMFRVPSFARKHQNHHAPPPPPPPPAEGEDTVEELRDKLKEFVETIMAVLRPYTDAYQAVLECCRQHATVTNPQLKFAT